MRRFSAALASAALIVSVFTSALAACMAGAFTPESAQMACCSMGHEDCEQAGAAMDCCKKTAPPPQQIFAAQADPFNGAVRHVLVSLTTALPVDFGAALTPAPSYSDTSPPRLVGPPSYIAFETLLI